MLDKDKDAAVRISFDGSSSTSLRITAEAAGEVPLDFTYVLADSSAGSSTDLKLTRSTLLDVTLRRAYEQFISPSVSS